MTACESSRAGKLARFEMVELVVDGIVAAADIVAVEAMSITNFLHEEGEVVAECMMAMLAWLNGVLCRATGLSEL